MTINELIQAFDNIERELRSELPAIMLTQAMDGEALVQLRIQTTGKSATGAQLPGYSNNKLPKWFFTDTSKYGSGLVNNVKGYQDEGQGISYREFRQLAGRQVNHYDGTFTGNMWKDTGVIAETNESGSKIRITIGGKNQGAKNKLSWNSIKRGDILAISKEELAILQEGFTEKIIEIFTRNGLK